MHFTRKNIFVAYGGAYGKVKPFFTGKVKTCKQIQKSS